jgi:uncharacterized phage-associated protein
MFSEKRVSQMAAYLLNKRGGRMAYIKLLKLLYLAEREAMAKWGESISGDRFVSMPHGPVLSQTYDLIKGHSGSQSFWNEIIQDESNYEVSLKNSVHNDTFDELSIAELELLDETFQRYGHMSRFQIIEYTHDHCPEWQDPNGSSYPIKPESIFRALGKTENQIQEMLKNYNEQQELDRIRASLA